jgi:hypothetical protein
MKTLIFAVGGGNDSISSLMFLLQEKISNVDIAIMLPDCLTYNNIVQLDCPGLVEIQENSTRHLINNTKQIEFIDVELKKNLHKFESLNIKSIYGFIMSYGSVGVLNGLKHLININQYDKVIALDVGGDFIAHKDNLKVLSPMMDGYALYALKNLPLNIEYVIMGLGCDGESTPEMLDKALSLVSYKEKTFDINTVKPYIDFYKNQIEPKRYSRTADYSIKELDKNTYHSNPSVFRARFNIMGEKFYGNFSHLQDEKFYGKYYSFNDVSQVNNVFCIECNSSLEWYLKLNEVSTDKLNHELNGQIIGDIYFGTPSDRFTDDQQIEILKLIIDYIKLNNLSAYVWNEYLNQIDIDNCLKIEKINNLISLVKF